MFTHSIQDILICEDHPFARLGLELSLKNELPNLKSTRLAKTGQEAIAIAKQQRPDLAIIDLGLPDISGVELIQELKKIAKAFKILVVTACDNPAILLQVQKLGVIGIIQKTSSPEYLRACFHSQTKEPQVFIDPAIKNILKYHEDISFTPKEYEVLQEIVKGHSNQEIADSLGCAVTTVRFHRANILQKTDIRTGAELAAWFFNGQRKRN